MRLTRWTIILLALLGLGLSGCVRQSVSEQAIGWDYVPGMLKRIVPPTFPSRDFIVSSCCGKTKAKIAYRKKHAYRPNNCIRNRCCTFQGKKYPRVR